MSVNRSRFINHTALITGGGSGIGRAAALAFAAEGAAVVVAGRRERELKETVALVEAAGGRAASVVADVAVAADAERMVEKTVRLFGALDIAFNNAGILAAGERVGELDERTWNAVTGVNLTGVWLSMKYEIAHMKAHGGGAIVNTASNIGSHSSRAGLGVYGASKAAVGALTRTAAVEYIGDGIRINSVSPGPIDTTMSLRPGETAEGRQARMADALPAGRVGRVEEAVAAVLWLAAAESGFTVGHDLVVDGGASV